MSDIKVKKPAEQVKPELIVPLDEFCTALSKSDNRVELISGFHMTMRLQKKMRATQAEYRKAFEAFLTTPA